MTTTTESVTTIAPHPGALAALLASKRTPSAEPTEQPALSARSGDSSYDLLEAALAAVPLRQAEAAAALIAAQQFEDKRRATVKAASESVGQERYPVFLAWLVQQDRGDVRRALVCPKVHLTRADIDERSAALDRVAELVLIFKSGQNLRLRRH